MPPLNKLHLHQIFNKLDKNGDGLVTIDELMWLLERIGIHSDRDELERLIGDKALNGIDFLFFYESLTIKIQESCDLERQDEILLRNAFRVFDLNDDGFISSDELQNALKRLGLWDDEDCGRDCKDMIAAYDADADGLLDFEEFKDMMLLDSLSSF